MSCPTSPTCLPTCLPACLPACPRACPRTYLPACLPACLPCLQASWLWSKLQELLSAVREALQELSIQRTQADSLINEARVFYELVSEASSRQQMSMMDAAKAGKAVGSNLKLLVDAKAIFTTLSENIKRIALELENVELELPKRMAKLLAEPSL